MLRWDTTTHYYCTSDPWRKILDVSIFQLLLGSSNLPSWVVWYIWKQILLVKERETEKRRAATDSAQEPELGWSTARMVAAVNYCPLPFFCWIIQKLATVPAPPPVSNGISHSARCWPSPSQRAPAGHTSHYQRLSARNNTFKPFQLSGHGWRRRLWGGEAGARRGYMILHWWNGDKIVTWICNGDILSRSPAHSCAHTGYPTSYVWCHWGGHW